MDSTDQQNVIAGGVVSGLNALELVSKEVSAVDDNDEASVICYTAITMARPLLNARPWSQFGVPP
jgi:hypothetical protein